MKHSRRTETISFSSELDAIINETLCSGTLCEMLEGRSGEFLWTCLACKFCNNLTKTSCDLCKHPKDVPILTNDPLPPDTNPKSQQSSATIPSECTSDAPEPKSLPESKSDGASSSEFQGHTVVTTSPPLYVWQPSEYLSLVKSRAHEFHGRPGQMSASGVFGPRFLPTADGRLVLGYLVRLSQVPQGFTLARPEHRFGWFLCCPNFEKHAVVYGFLVDT